MVSTIYIYANTRHKEHEEGVWVKRVFRLAKLHFFSVFANFYCSINKKRGLGIRFRYSLSSSDDSMADGYAEAMWLCSRAATMAFSMHA